MFVEACELVRQALLLLLDAPCFPHEVPRALVELLARGIAQLFLEGLEVRLGARAFGQRLGHATLLEGFGGPALALARLLELLLLLGQLRTARVLQVLLEGVRVPQQTLLILLQTLEATTQLLALLLRLGQLHLRLQLAQ